MPSRRTCVATPESLAGPFADLTLRRIENWTEPHRGGILLDPGCGSGLFLKLMSERLPVDQGWSFRGVEVDDDLARRALENLSTYNVKIYHGDFLFDGWREGGPGGSIWAPKSNEIRAVIGNPPYLGFKSQGAELRGRLSAAYGPGFGKCDLSGYSMIRSLNLVKPGGLVALILPRYWLEGGAGSPLRDCLTRECDIVEIRQWPRGHLFPGAGVQVLALWARKRIQPGDSGRMAYCLMPGKRLDGDPLARRSLEWSHERGPWPLLLKSEERYLDIQRSRGGPLEEWAVPAQGIITGADRSPEGEGLFVLEPGEAARLGLSSEEKCFLHPWIKSRQLEPLRTGETNSMLLQLPPGADLTEFPGVKRHLLKYKSHLERRREVARGRIPWWSLQWGRKEDLFYGARILLPAKARTVRAAAAPEGTRFSADIYTWRLRAQRLNRLQNVEPTCAAFWLALYFSSRFGRLSSRLLGKKLGLVVELYPQTQRRVPVPEPGEAGWREISLWMTGRLSPAKIAASSADELYDLADELVAHILKPAPEEQDLIREIESLWSPSIKRAG